MKLFSERLRRESITGMSEDARYRLRFLAIAVLVLLLLLAIAYDISHSAGKSGQAISQLSN